MRGAETPLRIPRCWGGGCCCCPADIPCKPGSSSTLEVCCFSVGQAGGSSAKSTKEAETSAEIKTKKKSF